VFLGANLPIVFKKESIIMEKAVLSYGLGVDSTAILLRWIYEPETCPCPLNEITVITSMTGDEFDQTGKDVIEHILPLMRKHGIRFVQVARHGQYEADGITILSDSREPHILYIKGDYKLSDELAASGVVPSYSGPHTCSLKSKAAVIESWLDNHYDSVCFGHAFGYSAEEPTRVIESDDGIRKRNEKLAVRVEKEAARNVAFGFNSEEMGRVKKAEEYDTPQRIGFYPLVEWGWTRQECIDYILSKTGIIWQKSACVYCPFGHNKANLVQLQTRHIEHPIQVAESLMLERMSLALNPRGQLYRAETLMEMTMRAGNAAALNFFQASLDGGEWAIYRVRRLYGVKAGTEGTDEPKKGTVQRAVEKLVIFKSEQRALEDLQYMTEAKHLEPVLQHGIHYAYVQRRGEGYPAREEYFVVAPERVEDKTRYGIEKFNAQWAPQATQESLFPIPEAA
jgi:hypothetical protein